MQRMFIALLVACVGVSLLGSGDARAETKLEKSGGKWQLLYGGKPYVIHGVGGSGPKDLLSRLGGNSFRTWDAHDIGPMLDEASRLGLSVTVGIWLKHERHGFSYNDPEFVGRQFQMVREQVTRYKDHPAVLMWALGNEMEGEKGENAAVWSHINSCAALVKQIDPTRPTITVIAELGGDKVRHIERLCPNIDVLGINTYAGAPSVIDRYLKLGGTKPVVITEFGPVGTWEVEPNAFGELVEPTSTQKAEMYRRHYDATVRHPSGVVLGSYAFTWGAKQEGTATWFGMLLPDGTKLNSVDAVVQEWTGNWPANRCPEIKPIVLSAAGGVVQPGETIEASVDCTDPENDPLDYRWVLQAEVAKRSVGGDPELVPPIMADAVKVVAAGRVSVTLPTRPGGYRLYAIVHDGKGSAATASAAIQVAKPAQTSADPSHSPAEGTPLVDGQPILHVYGDGTKAPAPYSPAGWMGNHDAIALDEKSTDSPRSGKTCLKVEYKAADRFAGVAWQSPAGDWGEKPGGHDLTGATRVTFWARGGKGGEKVEFKFGIIPSDKPHHDSASGGVVVDLTGQWRQYEIPIDPSADLSCIKTGFCWVAAGQGTPIVFYLDDVQWVRG